MLVAARHPSAKPAMWRSQPSETTTYDGCWAVMPDLLMREFVLAIRAIWNTCNNGAPMRFRGEFYTHTLMTPFFNPGPNPFGQPKIMMARVGPPCLT
jgi:hypothetical protein